MSHVYLVVFLRFFDHKATATCGCALLDCFAQVLQLFVQATATTFIVTVQ